MCKCDDMKNYARDFIEDLELTIKSSCNFDEFAMVCKELQEVRDMICSKAKFMIAHASIVHLLKKFELDSLDDFGL